MAQVLHQRATITHAIREDIQRSTESVATLSRRYGINPKTVRKWRSRTSVEDMRMGPKAARSKSLTPLEEAAAITFRQKTLLPLDDCLHALQREIPSLTRSSLHRLYQRHGISQRPRVSETTREKKSFKNYPNRLSAYRYQRDPDRRRQGLTLRCSGSNVQVRSCTAIPEDDKAGGH